MRYSSSVTGECSSELPVFFSSFPFYFAPYELGQLSGISKRRADLLAQAQVRFYKRVCLLSTFLKEENMLCYKYLVAVVVYSANRPGTL